MCRFAVKSKFAYISIIKYPTLPFHVFGKDFVMFLLSLFDIYFPIALCLLAKPSV